MIIVCPTVPHTGTHFMADMFQRCDVSAIVVHPYPDQLPELEKLIDEANPVIVPARRRIDVQKSWIKYGKDLENFAGRSLGEWFEVQRKLVQGALTYYLDIDEPAIRVHQLALINKDLELNLVTDWQPIRQAAA